MINFRPPFFLLMLLAFLLSTHLIAQPVINEICSRNTTVLYDEDGKASDWIEIKNQGGQAINLTGWWLSDNVSDLQKWMLPEIVIPADSFQVVFASGNDRSSVFDHWETAIHAEDMWRYWIPDTNPPSNWNIIGFADTSWLEGPGGFGRGDDDDNTVLPDSVYTVYIRKSFQIADTGAIQYAILHMDYDDAFVAYLNGVEIVRTNIGWPGKYQNFNDWSYDVHEAVMKDSLPPEAFRIDMDLFKSVVLPGENVLAIQGHNAWNNHGNSSLIPFLSFAISDTANSYSPLPDWFTEEIYNPHTNFGLSSDGEGAYLSNPAGELISFIEFPYLKADQSYGRANGSETNVYFAQPTPGLPNGVGALGYAKVPYFSEPGGFYSDPLMVEISNFQAGDTIRYTTDGSWVSDTSEIYSTAIPVDSTMVIKAQVYKHGFLPGKTTTDTYIIGYTSQLPVISISMNPHDLWDWEEGIYVLGPNAEPNPPHFEANFWMDWEKPIHLEYFDTAQNLGFELDADVVIHGGYSRDYPQKSLRILTDGKYDQDRIEYQLFPDKEIYEFKKLILRNSGQDYNVTQFRDGVMHEIVKTGTHNDYQAFQPAVLFLNGAYWGVQNMREKIDRFYTSSNFGIHTDSVDILRDNNKVVEGDYYHYERMIAYLKTFWIVNEQKYDSLSKLLDIENYSDYFITEMYYTNLDWPRHNTKYWRKRDAGGKWRYILSDVDFGLGLFHSPTLNELNRVLHGTILWSSNHFALRRLVTYEPYKQYFINRSADLFNTILNPDHITSNIYNVRDLMAGEMQNHMPRWGSTYETWEQNVQVMIDFAEERHSHVWQHYIQEFELVKTVEIAVDIDSLKCGKIRLNTLTHEEYPWQGLYFDGNPVELEAIADSGYLFSHWESNFNLSAGDSLSQLLVLNVDTNAFFKAHFIQDTFQLDTPFVLISEINYRSSDTLDTKDWLELWNPDSVAHDLSGWLFRDGNDDHQFYLPSGTILQPDEFLVLCEDTAAFDTFNPEIANRIGPLGFGLSAEGEALRIYNADSLQFFELTYSNVDPWPGDADGTGKTINLDDPYGDINNGSNWFSGCVGGSPGGAYEPCDTIAVFEYAQLNDHIHIYPNPALDKVFIEIKFKTETAFTIEFTDFSGVPVFYEKYVSGGTKPNTIEIPLKRFAKGIYLVKISSNNSKHIEKLVIR